MLYDGNDIKRYGEVTEQSTLAILPSRRFATLVRLGVVVLTVQEELVKLVLIGDNKTGNMSVRQRTDENERQQTEIDR